MNYLVFLIVLSADVIGRSQVAMTAQRELTIFNFDMSGPTCIVKVSYLRTQCTAEGYMLKLPKGPLLESLPLNFSNLPK